MAYDEQLAARVRELMAARPGVVERKMFGGVGWMVGGNMAVGGMGGAGVVGRLEPGGPGGTHRAGGGGAAGRAPAGAGPRPPGPKADEGVHPRRAGGRRGRRGAG